ncbi:MAG: hypothetical protein QM704_05630 [Anaeromyxobacteraceae bacterium]
MKANKLLRVLVVGGIALAGSAGAARADDKPAGEAQKETKHAAKGDAKAKDAKAKKDAEAKKEKEEKEKKDGEAGGVKGW